MAQDFQLKDSGKRVEFESGMRRDTNENKPRFDLIIPETQQYEETLLYRIAMQLQKGMAKYGYRNWELANSKEELIRFKTSAWRHFIQAMSGNIDEDHFAACAFNLNALVYLMDKMKVDIHGNPQENKK